MVETMLVAIERSVPVPLASSVPVLEPAEADEMVLAANVLLCNLLALGLDYSAAVDRVATSEPFDQVPGIAERLRIENVPSKREDGG